MIKIVTNEQMRLMDDYTIKTLGVPGVILMENAGRQTYEYICDFLAENNLTGTIDIYCGKGNNGGDGFVIARHLSLAGYAVQIFCIGNPEELRGDAKINYQICDNYKIPLIIVHTPDQLKSKNKPALIVDALLGTGIKGAVRGLFSEVIDHINASAVPVISVDIPSGLNGDSPAVEGKCVEADLTVTMALPKRAHIFYPAKFSVGQLEVTDIGMPASVKENPDVLLNLVEYSDLQFPILADNAHKYSNGKLFVLAGSAGMTGAASLAASAALRTGVGLVNIGIPKSLNPIMEIKVTEALTIPLPETNTGTLSIDALDKIKDRIEWADAVIIGPGSGREAETLDILIASIAYCNEINKAALIDADALFALAQKRELLNKLGACFILTPHHGEFKRLADFSAFEIDNTPWQCLQTFLQDKNCYINLKGAPSMVAAADGQIYVNPTGNPGLAKGGSGDVLAGIIGGLMARGIDPLNAAITGNFIHGEAADLLLVSHGADSLLPSDLIQVLPEILALY